MALSKKKNFYSLVWGNWNSQFPLKPNFLFKGFHVGSFTHDNEVPLPGSLAGPINTLIILKKITSERWKGWILFPAFIPTSHQPWEAKHLSVLSIIQIMAQNSFCIFDLCCSHCKEGNNNTKKKWNWGIWPLVEALAVTSHGYTICISGGTPFPSVALLRINEASSGSSLRLWNWLDRLEHSVAPKLAQVPPY